jgi:hypothetical protein
MRDWTTLNRLSRVARPVRLRTDGPVMFLFEPVLPARRAEGEPVIVGGGHGAPNFFGVCAGLTGLTVVLFLVAGVGTFRPALRRRRQWA